MAYYSQKMRLLNDGAESKYNQEGFISSYIDDESNTSLKSKTTSELIEAYNEQLREFNKSVEAFTNVSSIYQTGAKETEKYSKDIWTDYELGNIASIPGISTIDSIASHTTDIFNLLVEQKEPEEKLKDFLQTLVNIGGSASTEMLGDIIKAGSLVYGIGTQLTANQLELLANTGTLQKYSAFTENYEDNINVFGELMNQEALKLVEVKNELEMNGIEVPRDFETPIQAPEAQKKALGETDITLQKPESKLDSTLRDMIMTSSSAQALDAMNEEIEQAKLEATISDMLMTSSSADMLNRINDLTGTGSAASSPAQSGRTSPSSSSSSGRSNTGLSNSGVRAGSFNSTSGLRNRQNLTNAIARDQEEKDFYERKKEIEAQKSKAKQQRSERKTRVAKPLLK